MGQCVARRRSLDDPDHRQDRRILEQNKIDYEDELAVHKLLLLGPGESGKSTIFKQVNYVYGEGVSQDERQRHAPIVYNNLYIGMKTLIKYSERFAREEAKFAPQSEEAERAALRIQDLDYHDDLDEKVGESLQVLWQDSGIQETFMARSRFQLPYPVDYFMGRIEEMCLPDYIPTNKDMIWARARTTGIAESRFEMHDNRFLIMDVGGQRNERSKWIHCFENVTCILFVAAVSEYDQVLYEDSRVNRLEEALHLFEEICNLKIFENTAIILFLNKYDLLQEKIHHVPLRDYVNDYLGEEGNLEQVSFFLREKFDRLNRNIDRKVVIHFTCATDDGNIRDLFDGVRSIIVDGGMDDVN